MYNYIIRSLYIRKIIQKSSKRYDFRRWIQLQLHYQHVNNIWIWMKLCSSLVITCEVKSNPIYSFLDLVNVETDIIIEKSWESHERKTFKTAHSWYLHSRSLCRKVKNLSNTRRIGLMTVLIEKSTSYLLWLSVLEPIICRATLRIFERFFLSQLNHLGFRLIWFCVLLFGESFCIERCRGRTFDRKTKMNPDQTVHNL